MRDIIIKHALLNAADFGGKANVQSVMGKVLGENPELKSDMAALGRETALLVKEVNSWPPEKQKEELAKFGKIEKPEKVEREGLPPLPNAIQGNVVTRMPPEPSKYNHIGHALTFLINYMYAKMYDGKCILRFEDTNPEKVKQEYVDAMQDDVLDYLGIKPDKTVFVSDDMPAMYKHVERMIENGDTYVCMCDREAMQNMRHEGIECEHRSNSAEENMRLWKEMLGRSSKRERPS
jgi:glutamyl-tRNA synthetase